MGMKQACYTICLKPQDSVAMLTGWSQQSGSGQEWRLAQLEKVAVKTVVWEQLPVQV